MKGTHIFKSLVGIIVFASMFYAGIYLGKINNITQSSSMLSSLWPLVGPNVDVKALISALSGRCAGSWEDFWENSTISANSSTVSASKPDTLDHILERWDRQLRREKITMIGALSFIVLGVASVIGRAIFYFLTGR